MKVLPAAQSYMPPMDAYLALAGAMHDEDEICNANYDIPFSACGTREYDIELAVRVLVGLHKEGWRLVRDPGGMLPLGLVE